MSLGEVLRVLEDVERQVGIVRANLERAWVSAVALDEVGGREVSGESAGPVSGGAVGSPVEAAVLRRAGGGSTKAIERAAAAAGKAMQVLAHRVVASAPPRVRNAPDGSVVVDCGNVHGCPEGKTAKREGRCAGCWDFNDRHGRDRSAADWAAAIAAARAGAAARKRAQREREAGVPVD